MTGSVCAADEIGSLGRTFSESLKREQHRF